MKEISTNVLIGRNSFAKRITLPSIIILVLTVVGPLGFLLYASFFDWSLTVPAPPRFAWFYNFGLVFKDARFWNAFKNTSVLMTAGIVVQSILGLILAFLLNRKFRFKKLA